MKSFFSRQRMLNRALGLALLGLPYGLIYWTGLPRPVGRAAGLGVWMVLFPLVLLWVSINPRSRIIMPDSPLARPEHAGEARLFEGFVRVVCLAFCALFGWFATAPYARDIRGWCRGERPAVVRGRVLRSTDPFGLWFVRQGLRLDDGAYELLFSMEPRVAPGTEVRLLVLPRSRFVLERLGAAEPAAVAAPPAPPGV